jgi:AcrR family transcriptional regulator
MTANSLASPAVTDGRNQRAATNRAAVVDAMLALYNDGVLSPAAGEIAARAGVSERSVFRHFADLESLAATAIERQWARVGHHFAAPDHSGPLDQRIANLVAQRLAIHAAAAGAARAATLMAPSSPTIRHALTARRLLLRRQIAVQFAPEVAGLARPERAVVVAALDAACSFEQVEYLRVHAGLSAARTGAVIARTLHALLSNLPG